MDTHQIAVVCAMIGALMTPIYLTLGFVGVKMLGERWFEIGIVASLAIIIGVLTLAVVASIVWPKREAEA